MACARLSTVIQKLRVTSHIRCFSSAAGGSTTSPPSSPQKPPVPPSKGPSTAKSSEVTTDPTKYNAPEYYQHNSFSYYDTDNSMLKFRQQQPNKFEPLKPKK